MFALFCLSVFVVTAVAGQVTASRQDRSRVASGRAPAAAHERRRDADMEPNPNMPLWAYR